MCNTGYYASTATTCAACAASMIGCTSCTTASNCLICDTVAHFVASGTSCTCEPGYSLQGTTCIACMVGCALCSTSTTCTTCNAAAHYVSSGSVCVCDAASGYTSSGGTCQACSSLIAGCLTCSSSSVCTSCQTGPSQVMILTATNSCACPPLYTYDTTLQDCVSCTTCCQYGEYFDSGTSACLPCGTKFTGCVACAEAACSVCTDGYYLNGGVCASCSVIPGCLSCTDASTCISCNSAGNFLLSAPTCACEAGFALSTGNSCAICSSTLPGCLLCTSQSVCTSCDISNNFMVDPSNSS